MTKLWLTHSKITLKHEYYSEDSQLGLIRGPPRPGWMATLELRASWSNFFRGGSGGGISGSSLSLCKLPHELKKVSGGGKDSLSIHSAVTGQNFNTTCEDFCYQNCQMCSFSHLWDNQVLGAVGTFSITIYNKRPNLDRNYLKRRPPTLAYFSSFQQAATPSLLQSSCHTQVSKTEAGYSKMIVKTIIWFIKGVLPYLGDFKKKFMLKQKYIFSDICRMPEE